MDPKIIVALDFSNDQQALALVDQLNPKQCALKVGSEMFTLFGKNFVSELIQKGFKVFLDLKFHDIPNTVAKACSACAELGVWMINVHASGGLAMMKAAKEAITSSSNRPLLIAVTVLTSLNSKNLAEIGIETTMEDQVYRLAELAYQAKLDGVVCSAFEVARSKAIGGASFLTVTPGIRFQESEKNDQSRVVTPQQAISMGADYLVMGRSITQAADPKKALNQVLAFFS